MLIVAVVFFHEINSYLHGMLINAQKAYNYTYKDPRPHDKTLISPLQFFCPIL